MKPLSQHIQEGFKENDSSKIEEDLLDRINPVDDKKEKPSGGTDGL